MAEHFVRVGLLVNGIEFIPQEVVDRHTPFAPPPGTDIQVAYVRTDDPWEATDG